MLLVEFALRVDAPSRSLAAAPIRGIPADRAAVAHPGRFPNQPLNISHVSGYAICNIDDVPDAFGGQYPGAMRFLTDRLGAEQVAFTHRLMPPGSGGKGAYGHRHRTQEEIYFVISGELQFKLDDDIVECERGAAVRVAPEVFRSIWNDEPDDAEIVIVSTRVDDSKPEYKPDFWPE